MRVGAIFLVLSLTAVCSGAAMQPDPKIARAASKGGSPRAPAHGAAAANAPVAGGNDDAGTHYNLANELYEKNDLDGAVAEYREAIRLNPDFAEAHNNLGVALQRKGDLDGAVAEHREATRLNPNYSEAHSNLGAALGNKGDLNGAIAEWREALRLDPNNAVAQKYLDQALKELPK